MLPSPKQAELAVKWSSILQCLCNVTIEEKKKKKKEKGKLMKCRTADTTTKKVLGVHSACTRTMPGPAIEIDDL